MNRECLELLKYVQEKQITTIKKVATKFNKNESTIRREIESINLYFADEDMIKVQNSKLSTNLTYEDFTQFIKTLTLKDYVSSRDERITIILLMAFLNETVNLTKLYEKINLSNTTKKNDTKQLKSLLEQNQLELIIVKKKGIMVCGNENKFRLLILQRLQMLIELNQNDHLMPREANTPYEQYAINLFIENMMLLEEKVLDKAKYISDFLDVKMSYASRKFIILYLSVSIFRQENKHFIIKATEIPVSTFQLNLFNDFNENKELNHIISVLDTYPQFNYPFNEELWCSCESYVNQYLNDTYKNEIKDAFIREIYNFSYKQIFSNILNVSFDDKLVRHVEETLPEIFNCANLNKNVLVEKYGVVLNTSQVHTLVLITKKWLDIIDSCRRESLRIVLLTNIISERADYFIEQLQAYFDVKIILICNYHDIERINEIDYDFIIVFSNRMYSIAKNRFKKIIKLNFFLNNIDHELLYVHGFKSARKRIITSQFIKDFKQIPSENLEKQIQTKYTDHFL